MASYNVIKACLAKFDALDASNFPSDTRPARAFDELPVVNGLGAQLSAEDGYVCLKDDGSEVVGRDSERQIIEAFRITWEVYYPDLGHCLSAADAIRKNGGTLQQGLGFDNGALELTSPRATFDCLYLGGRSSKESGNGKTGKLVHCHRLHYALAVREVS